MKKTLLLIAALAALTQTASALSFNWSATGVEFGGSKLKNDANVTGYLIYLGNGGSLSTSYDLAADSTVDSVISSIGTKVDTKNKTSAVGKLTGTYTFDYGGTPGQNGDAFAVLVSYVSEGTTYYNLSSAVTTLSGLEDDGTVISNQDFTMNYGTKGESSSLSAGSGWTAAAVPEPSTAALALAGLALLLKRRKA